MKYCHQCGYNLTLGIEKFCPSCGTSFQQNEVSAIGGKDDNKISSIGIHETEGDVLGAGITGSGNIIGKNFTLQGSVLIINTSGSIPEESIKQIKNVITSSTQLESKISQEQSTTEDNIIKTEKANTTKQQITTVLDEVERIEKKEGTQIQEIKAGDLQISRNELILKDYVSKGNAHYYKEEYTQAIKLYDEALNLDPNDVGVLRNKGSALDSLGKFQEAIEWYDKALEIDPNYVHALSNKGFALGNLGKYQEAIEEYDKVLEIAPNDVNALNNKGAALKNLGKFQEAIEWYDKALEIDPNNISASNNKGFALDDLGKYQEAIEEYDKVLEIAPNDVNALNNKGAALKNLGKFQEAVLDNKDLALQKLGSGTE